MSGFGSGSATGHGHRYHVECASVNRKGLEIVIALPRGFSSLEPKIREAVQKKISRGRIQVSVSDEIITSKNNTSIVDFSSAHHAFKELKKLQQSLQLSGEITLETILRAPGVLCTETTESIDFVVAWSSISKALEKALVNLIAMKAKEGKILAADLKKRFHFLEQSIGKISTRVPILRQYRQEQLRSRLADSNLPVAIDDPGLLRELVFFAERSDISEELTRLQSHLIQHQEILRESASSGRTLDYLAQEMFREFNTLSSKANDAEVSRWVVQSKSELDKIREQLANLE
ncbi:MAG: YicC/YloC family endoribonuclease [Chthoniobacterales bacterium]